MITIRKRISRPYLAIIIAVPICILILFNLIVSHYSKMEGEESLMNAVSTIRESIENGNQQNLLNLLKMRFQQGDTELIVYNKHGEMSRMFNQKENFVTGEIAKIAYEETNKAGINEISSFKYDGDSYYVISVEYESKSMDDRIVYIVKGFILDEFVTAVNLVLLMVSIIITAIAVYVSTRVTNSVAKPIERITNLVENMKSDEIIIIDDKSDSLELQKLTNEINALNKRIYYYNESQKNFLHNASHELRTPLMSIQGYADGIEMGVFEDAKGTAHLISEQSKRLTRLVDSLLTLARAENFNSNKKLERLNVSEALSNMIGMYKGYALSSNIELKDNICPNLYINANSELLTGSTGNIISNAIRYAKNIVSISLVANENKAIITIRDDGNGIENIDNIFDRFSKGEKGNFGLGLSIAKTSAEMMNGHIKAYNDNGAVFEIHLDLL